MSDGRHFTDYRPRCAINFESQPRPMSSYDYRMYLTKHAQDIIGKNRDIASYKSVCESCVKDLSHPPENNVEECTSRVCSTTRSVNERDGFGFSRRSRDHQTYPWDGTGFAGA